MKPVLETLQLIGRDLDPKLDDLLKYRVSVAEACFLFGSEISQYIEEIFKRGLNLKNANREYHDFMQGSPPSNYDHAKVVQEMHTESTWLIEQLSIVEGRLVVAEKFRPYLDISK